MKQRSTATFSKRTYCATIAILFGRVVSIPVVHAGAPDRVVLVPQTRLKRDWMAADDRQELPFNRAQAAAATSPGAEPRAVP